ncbi:MAG: DUF1858 domain-containing protein [Defluviitaleaceae bacterium]|nr:DUF1858 domain-containing protein [Defluviitaleaceae bacterium]
MATVNKEMLISEILEIDRGLAVILMNHGMHCVGCPSARYESLEQATVVHGMDVDAIIEQMNAYLAEPKA